MTTVVDPQIAEIVADMRRIQGADQVPGEPTDDVGLTMNEWCRAWALPKPATIRRLRTLQNAGQLVVGRKRILRMDGVLFRVPCYAVSMEVP